jgi:hypothetical protein
MGVTAANSAMGSEATHSRRGRGSATSAMDSLRLVPQLLLLDAAAGAGRGRAAAGAGRGRARFALAVLIPSAVVVVVATRAAFVILVTLVVGAASGGCYGNDCAESQERADRSSGYSHHVARLNILFHGELFFSLVSGARSRMGTRAL